MLIYEVRGGNHWYLPCEHFLDKSQQDALLCLAAPQSTNCGLVIDHQEILPILSPDIGE